MNGLIRRFNGRGWVGPALLASLVLNLFLVGLLAGPMFFHRPPHKEMRVYGPPSPFMGMLDRRTRSLPEDDRAAIRNIMVEQFPNIRPYFRKIGESRMALADALGGDPYDPEKVRAAFDDLDKAFGGMNKVLNESVIQGFSKLPADQRARIAQAMKEKVARRKENRRDHEKEQDRREEDAPGASSAQE